MGGVAGLVRLEPRGMWPGWTEPGAGWYGVAGQGEDQPYTQGWWKSCVVGAWEEDAAETWTEGVASTSNWPESGTGEAMPEVTDVSATGWNTCASASSWLEPGTEGAMPEATDLSATD